MKLTSTYLPLMLVVLVLGGCSSGGASTAEDEAFQKQIADAAKNGKSAGKKNTLAKVGDGRMAPANASTGSPSSGAPGSGPAAPSSGGLSAPSSSGN